MTALITTLERRCRPVRVVKNRIKKSLGEMKVLLIGSVEEPACFLSAVHMLNRRPRRPVSITVAPSAASASTVLFAPSDFTLPMHSCASVLWSPRGESHHVSHKKNRYSILHHFITKQTADILRVLLSLVVCYNDLGTGRRLGVVALR